MPVVHYLNIDDYPQLRLIAWNRQGCGAISEAEAFALYERNWDFVDVSRLDTAEQQLIQRLTEEYGQGIMNV
ncbi:MAG: hypothetical protein LBU46_06210 [Candidatus Accumulibacter sp.]|jgi:hypothetical protein|nr:hypothetical protein [Accumulibacter sp.]